MTNLDKIRFTNLNYSSRKIKVPAKLIQSLKIFSNNVAKENQLDHLIFRSCHDLFSLVISKIMPPTTEFINTA